MPESMSIERRKSISAYGAELVLTPKEKGMQGAVDKANELKKEYPNSYIPMQFSNPDNPKAHEKTAREIRKAVGDRGIKKAASPAAFLFQKFKICQYHKPQHDAVITEHDKIVFLYVGHKEPDDKNADDKGHDASDRQYQQFASVKHEADPQNVFYQLQERSADHDGNGQVKGEFCRYAAFQPDQQSADDSGTGAGSAGDQGKQLEYTHLNGFGIRNVMYVFNFSGTDIPGFDQDEKYTVENQGNRYHFRCKKMFFHPVVEQDADDGSGKAGGNDFSPEIQRCVIQCKRSVFSL